MERRMVGRRSVLVVALSLLVAGPLLVYLEEAPCGELVGSSARPFPFQCGPGEVLVELVLAPAGPTVGPLCSSFPSPGWSLAGLVPHLCVALEESGKSCLSWMVLPSV
jgi:hypothetical protein